MNCSLPFGEKVIIFGGEFRQVLLIAPKKIRAEQIDASVVRSSIWHTLGKIKLWEKMRAISDPIFSNYLLCIGNGTEPTFIIDLIKLPPHMIIPYIDKHTSLNVLIEHVFLDLETFCDKSRGYGTTWNINSQNWLCWWHKSVSYKQIFRKRSNISQFR